MVLQRYRAKQVPGVPVSSAHTRPARARPTVLCECVPAHIVQELGKGSFGTVYLTEGRRDKKAYVVKVLARSL